MMRYRMAMVASLAMMFAATLPAYAAKSAFDTTSSVGIRIDPHLNDQYNYFRLAPPPTLTLRIDSPKDQGSCEALLDIVDYWHNSQHRETQTLSLTPGDHTLSITPRINREGYYELHVKVMRDGQTLATSWTPFVLLSRNNDPYVGPESGFGITSHLVRWQKRWGDKTPMSDSFRIQKLAGMTWTRSDQGDIDAQWARKVVAAGLEPLSVIIYQWNYDQWVDPQAPDTPLIEKWEKRGIPKTLSGFAEHIYQTVKANKDTIHTWEMGNEPTYWHVLPEDYAQLTRAGVIAAKLAAPHCTVMLGDMVFLHQPVLHTGVARVCDAVAIHIYGYLRRYFWGIPTRLYQLKADLLRSGVDPLKKPIWLTETGGNGYGIHIQPGKSKAAVHHYQALDTVKKLAGSRAAGADKVLIYNFRDKPTTGPWKVSALEGEFGMIHSNRLPKPAFMAYRTTARLLARCTPLGAIKLSDDRFKGFAFKTSGGEVAVMWRKDDPGELSKTHATALPPVHEPVELAFASRDKHVRVYDIMGGSKDVARGDDGKVHIGVNEYPVFVAGDVDYDIDTNYNRVDRAKVTDQPAPPVMVRIYPGTDTKYDARELMYTNRLTLVKNKKQRVMVRVYNTTDHPIAGKVALDPPGYFLDDGWTIKSVVDQFTIPAQGMKTAMFDVNIPAPNGDSKLGYLLGAQFTTSDGKQYEHHSIVRQVKEKETNAKAD